MSYAAPAKNWASNYAYRANVIHRPTSIEQVQAVVSRAARVRVLGTRHSFTNIADSDELISLSDLPADVSVDRERGTVTCGAGLRYGDLAAALNREGLALHNMASLPQVAVGGAVATGTHGSGDGNGNLATAVCGVEMVTSSGEIVRIAAGDAEFEGAVVGLGALGAVTRLTLRVEPAYEVQQRVFEGLAWDTLFQRFDEVMGAGYSVSLFTSWGRSVDQVWVKSRGSLAVENLFGATAASVQRHPIIELDPVNCTAQLGVPGLWSERLPHFRFGFTPSSGDEIQAEYMVPRTQAVPALQAMRRLAERMQPLLQISEIRTVAGDSLWMSPQYARDTVAIHFTWRNEQQAVEELLVAIEAALEPFGARPHWGKLFVAEAAAIAPLYERLGDFKQLLGRLDPRGAFRNPWLERHVLNGVLVS